VTAALVLTAAALLLGLAAVRQLFSTGGTAGADSASQPDLGPRPASWPAVLAADARLGISTRLARAGVAEGVPIAAVLGAKAGCAVAGALWAIVLAPAAPVRLSWVLALLLPIAGFFGPDAWLEHRARQRLRALRASLPDALDLLAVGAAAGRSPLAGLAELGDGDGALGRELAMLSADSSCGLPQSEALESLRRRAPVREVAAMCGVIERSRRYGSPLADQLREQATALRGAQRRRVEEHAARAAPKIQLAVALLLVPSVLLMIAAGLLANIDRFMSGF
jgi:tight adherence protein C